MNKIKTIPLTAETIEELAKKIERFQNNSNLISKGSIPFSNLPTGEVGVIMFYPRPIDEPDEIEEEKTYPQKQFVPTERLLEKWKKTEPSKKTLALLKRKGFSGIELKQIKSQYDAHKLLESLKKENI